jgi:hypothetical protein
MRKRLGLNKLNKDLKMKKYSSDWEKYQISYHNYLLEKTYSRDNLDPIGGWLGLALFKYHYIQWPKAK